MLALWMACAAPALAFWPGLGGSAPAIRIQWADGAVSEPLVYGGFVEAPRAEAPLALRAARDPKSRGAESFSCALLNRIEFHNAQILEFGSNETAVQFSLGPAAQRIPGPPDWFSPGPNPPHWKAARPAPVDPRWTPLPGSVWLWTTSEWEPALGEKVLFRQSFRLPASGWPARATLWVGADHQLGEVWLNGEPLPWRDRALGGRNVSASVERMARPGVNWLAISATAAQGGQIAASGAAWRLTVIWVEDPQSQSQSPSRDRRGARDFPFSVRLADGGWIPAQRAQLDSRRLRLERENGSTLELPRPLTRWLEHWPRIEAGAVFARPLAPGEASPAIPSSYDQALEEAGVWDPAGRFARGKMEKWAPLPDRPTEIATREDWAGETAPSATGARVARAVLTAPDAGASRWTLPRGDLARLARALTMDGTTLYGLLEPSDAREVILSLPAGGRARLAAEELLWLDFPAAPAARARARLDRWLNRSGAGRRIALLGDVPCREGPQCPDSVAPEVERVAQALGLRPTWTQPLDLVAPGMFTPAQFPLAINLDQSEAYYHSIRRTGDGHQALLEYINRGGVLIHLAPGTPFYYGRQEHARQWSLVPLGGTINRALGLGIGAPGGEVEGQLFETPDNTAAPLVFERAAPAGWREGLPARVQFPPVADPRFRPVSPAPQRKGGVVIPLYRLRRGDEDLGLAAAVARLPRLPDADRPGYVVYVAWPLALGRDALGDSLLPALLPGILEAIVRDLEAQQSPADLAH